MFGSSFFGDTLLGAYELPYEDMLKAFTLASKNNNAIILNFIKNQVTLKPINLYDGINILMNDFATQQNVIMELLSEEVKMYFLEIILLLQPQILQRQDY